MAANMLTAYDVVQAGTAGQNAAQQFTDNQNMNQQNKIALKLQQMNLAELQKQQGVKNFLSSNWQQTVGGEQPTPGMQAPVMQPVGPINPDMAVTEQPPIQNSLAPQMMTTGVGAGQMLPGITDPSLQPQPAAPTPQVAVGAVAPTGQSATASPPAQYPTDEQLMKAVQSGKLPLEVANGVRAERMQTEQAVRLAQVKSKIEYYKSLGEKFAAEGNNEGFQNLMAQAQADKDVAGYIPKFDHITVTGKQETVAQTDMTETIRQNLLKQAGDNPLLVETISSIKEGQKVEIKQKAGRVTEIKPIKDVADATRTPEQLRKIFTDPKRSEAERKAAWEDFKLAPLTVNQLTAIKSNASLPAEYRDFATQTLKEMNAQKTAFHVSIKGSMNDDTTDSFKDYTPQMKEQAFKDRDLGQYRYPSGMMSLSEKKAFDREYYQYRASGKVDASDVASRKSDVKSDAFIAKQLDASKSFTKTIDNNIDQLESHIKTMSKTLNLDRNRILNMGTREFNKRLVGTANINIYDMLVSAISTENAKLQAGGAGSVAQVAEGARVDMKRVHDDNLPVSEMIKLMKATRREGENRLKALRDTRAEIKARIAGQSGSTAGKVGKYTYTVE